MVPTFRNSVCIALTAIYLNKRNTYRRAVRLQQQRSRMIQSKEKLLFVTVAVVLFLQTNSHLIILVERSTWKTSFPPLLNSSEPTTRVLPLDGKDCLSFSTGGSLLVSGVKWISEVVQRYNQAGSLASLQVVILSSECLKESLILESVLQMYHISSLVVYTSLAVETNTTGVVFLRPSSKVMIDAIFALSRSLVWNKLGVITDITDISFTRLTSYMEFVAERQNFIVSSVTNSQTLVRRDNNFEEVLDQVEYSGVKVIVLLTKEIPHILCAACHRRMVWPDYGWILLGSSMLEFNNCTCSTAGHLDGIIYLTYFRDHYTAESTLETAVIEMLHTTSTAAKQLNMSLEEAFMKTVNLKNYTFLNLQQNQGPNVYFVQVSNSAHTAVATFQNGKIINNQLQKKKLPNGRVPDRVNTLYPTWLGALEATVFGIAISVTMALFFCHRQEPEIRATTWSLSLLMLLACYMADGFIAGITIRAQLDPSPGFNLCSLLLWLAGIGLSYPLVLVVLLVKLVRVYRIFYHYSQVGKLCSNAALLLYVLILLFPVAAILTAMTSLQVLNWTSIRIPRKDYVEVLNVCAGDIGIYYIALGTYDVLLMVGVVVAAMKTRKLRHRNFRDAKMVNMFVFMVVLIGISTLLLYKIFSDLALYLYAIITLHIYNCSFIALSIGFLFLPKLSPVIYRKYFKKT